MMKKRAAFEMSMGTIVTIVLSVTLLVLGIFFVQNIFQTAKGVTDLTNDQLINEVNKLFSEENKMAIYPGTRFVEIKQENTDGVGIGIKNLLTGASGDKTFSYVTAVSDADLETKCGLDAAAVEKWIVTGRAESDIAIPSGDFSVQRVVFEIPVGAPLCTIRFRVNVEADGTPYATDFFDVKIKAK